MKLTISLSVLSLFVFGGGLPAYGQENLVLHRSYDYWPQPNTAGATEDGDITN